MARALFREEWHTAPLAQACEDIVSGLTTSAMRRFLSPIFLENFYDAVASILLLSCRKLCIIWLLPHGGYAFHAPRSGSSTFNLIGIASGCRRKARDTSGQLPFGSQIP